VVAGLARVGLFLKTQALREAHPRGLSPTQAELLALLARRFRGGARLAEVAEALAVSSPTASEAVSTLAAKGLVHKGSAGEDGRALRVTLTPRGRREASRASDWPEALMEAVDELSGPERSTLLSGLMKMIRSLQGRGLIPVSRMCASCRFFRPHAHDDARRPHHCDFVDARFGDAELRLDCDDHEPSTPEAAERAWAAFAGIERAGPTEVP
jgi:DNA-binding MarR family transcriptional regulator